MIPFIGFDDIRIEFDIAPLDGVVMPRTLTSPPFPQPFFHYVGVIAMMWGDLENWMNALIEAILNHHSLEDDGWERRNFRKRKEILKHLIKVRFPDNDRIIKYMSDLLGDAASLHWKRNLLVHGHLSLEVTHYETGHDIKLCATGFHNGKSLTNKYDLVQLSQLGVDISGVVSRFSDFGSPLGSHILPIPGLSSQDKYDLQLLMFDHQKSIPMPSSRPDPPTP